MTEGLEIFMTKRAISSFWLIVISVIVILCFGLKGCMMLVAAVSIMTQFEFYKLLSKIEQRPFLMTGMLCGITMLFVSIFCVSSNNISAAMSEMLFFSIVIVVVQALCSHSLLTSRKSITATLSGIIYIPFMSIFPIALMAKMSDIGMSDGQCIFTLFWLILTTKFCDIGGMFVGKYFGRHKLAPNFSPKKTFEGLIGGIFCSNIIAIGLLFMFPALLPAKLTVIISIVLATYLALLSIIGDLVESAIKRLANEKDSGTTLPGIGGVFDLSDSLLLALPFASIVLMHIVL